MTFPARQVCTRRVLLGLGPLTMALGLAVGLIFGTAVAAADDDPVPPPPGPPMHAVKYTVFSETPFRNAEIYYRDVDPPTFADYSHNPYQFSPNATADLGPNQSWTLDVTLADPTDWAMVTVSSLDSPKRPNFHCVMAVDGQVVATNQGPKGALCSIRNW